MSKDEVEAIRASSRAGKSGPWVTHWNEMAKKTAFRRLTKWLTLSPEIMDHVAKAEASEFSAMRNITPDVTPSDTNPFETKEAESVPSEDAPDIPWDAENGKEQA